MLTFSDRMNKHYYVFFGLYTQHTTTKINKIIPYEYLPFILLVIFSESIL